MNGAQAPFQGDHDDADGLVASGRVPRSRPYPSSMVISSVSPSPMRLPEPLLLVLNSSFFCLPVPSLNGAQAPFQGDHDDADGLVASGRVPRRRPYPSFMGSSSVSPSPMRFPEPLLLRLNSSFFCLPVPSLNGAQAPFQGDHDDADGLVASGRVPRSRPYPSFMGSSSVSPSPMRFPEPLPLGLGRP